MTVVAGAAAVPPAPLLLPEVSADAPTDGAAALRRAVGETLEPFPEVDVVLLVGPGPRGFRERARSSLDALGVDVEDLVLPVDAGLLTHATRLTQYPVLIGGGLSLENAVLARLVHRLAGEVPVLPVSVAPETDGQVLVNVGAGLVEALRDASRRGFLLASADLGTATAEDDGVPAWDRLALDAVRNGDADALAALGPAGATAAQARGWGPLTVLSGFAAAARLRPASPAGYARVDGIGRLWSRLDPSGSRDVGGAFRRDGTAPLRLPRDPGGG